VKALIEKIWYLTDQETVVMTSPADQQAGLPKVKTAQKGPRRPGAIPHQLPIKTTAGQKKNLTANVQEKKNLFQHQRGRHFGAKEAMMINHQTALAPARVKNVHSPERKDHIQAEQRISTALGVVTNHQAKRNHLLQEAGPIRAGLPIMMKDQKEVLEVQLPATSQAFPEINLQQALLTRVTGQKEVQVLKEPATKNLATGPRQVAGLKKHTEINRLLPTGRVQNLHTIK